MTIHPEQIGSVEFSAVFLTILIQRISSTQWKNFKKGVSVKIYKNITFYPSFWFSELKGATAEHDKSICRLEIIPKHSVKLNLHAGLLVRNMFYHSLPGYRTALYSYRRDAGCDSFYF